MIVEYRISNKLFTLIHAKNETFLENKNVRSNQREEAAEFLDQDFYVVSKKIEKYIIYAICQKDTVDHSLFFDEHYGTIIVLGENIYSYNEKIGNGAQGSIFKAFDLIREKKCALKIIPRSKAGNEVMISKELSKCDCNCFLNYSYTYETENTSYIIMDLCNNVIDIKSYYNFLDTKNKINFFKTLLICIQKLHKLGITHCDIKPDNLLVCDGLPKIIDFGLSTNDESSFTGGTPAFLDRDTLLLKLSNKRDIWALCVTIAELDIGQRLTKILGISSVKELCNKIKLNYVEKEYFSRIPTREIRDLVINITNVYKTDYDLLKFF